MSTQDKEQCLRVRNSRCASKYMHLSLCSWTQCYVCDLTVLRALSLSSVLAHCPSTWYHQSHRRAVNLCAAYVSVHMQVCVCKFSHNATQLLKMLLCPLCRGEH